MLQNLDLKVGLFSMMIQKGFIKVCLHQIAMRKVKKVLRLHIHTLFEKLTFLDFFPQRTSILK